MTEEVGRRLIDGVWVTNVEAQGGSGGGGITRVTSDDETVTITNPTGPVVDLSAGGGSQPITLEATAASVEQVSAEFASSGALGLYAEYLSDTVGGGAPDLYIVALARRAGLPWMQVGVALNGSSLGPLATFPSAEINDLTDGPFVGSLGFLGLMARNILAAIPVNTGGSPANASATTSFVDPDADLTYSDRMNIHSLGNRLSVELVDPGVHNARPSVSSPDGWAIVVSLQTDNTGAIVTTGGDVAQFLPGGLVAVSGGFATPVEAHAQLPLTGGDNGTPGAGISYRISNAP